MKALTVPTPTLPDGRYLPERDGHRVWWCETGLPEGVPVLVLHGGPGGRTRVAPFAWFDGLPVRCIAFDQRGCGQSTPAGGLEHNTLAHLVDDIERLRVELGLAEWAVVAGSWGVVVALAYAAARPSRVNGLFLRSAFLGSDAEVERFFEPWARWLGDGGAAWLGAMPAPGALSPSGPLGWLKRSAVPVPQGRSSPVSPARVALAWDAFEAAQARADGLSVVPGASFTPPNPPPPAGDLPPNLAVQAHYLEQHCFVTPGIVEGWLDLLQFALATRPVSLVHGLADAVCHPDVTAALAARWPHADVRWVEGGGHDMDSAPMRRSLTEAAQEWVGRIAASVTTR